MAYRQGQTVQPGLQMRDVMWWLAAKVTRQAKGEYLQSKHEPVFWVFASARVKMVSEVQ